MPAPTDTFVQTIVQGMPAAMQPYGVVLLFVAFVVAVLAVVALVVALEDHRAAQRREFWDRQLVDGRRNERRPAPWGEYK